MAAARKARGKRARARPIGKRRRAREMAIQMLYQHELADTPLEQIFASFDVADFLLETESERAAGPLGGDGESDSAEADNDAVTGTGTGAARPDERQRAEAEAAFEYARTLVLGSLDHGAEIDERIRHHAENWRLERMPAIDRNILRLAIYEMLYQSEVPKVVIVDEAIELAKRFGAENSGRFVNGLLDGVLKATAAAAPPAAAPPEADA